MILEKEPILIFDDSVKEKLLSKLGWNKNKESKIQSSNGKLITSQEFESIDYDEFGGVLKGSKIPITKSESALIKYFITKY